MRYVEIMKNIMSFVLCVDSCVVSQYNNNTENVFIVRKAYSNYLINLSHPQLKDIINQMYDYGIVPFDSNHSQLSNV